jgi:hypothetical protein
MDIAKHLNLAGRNLFDCLCPAEAYLPYWHMVVDEHHRSEYQFRPHCNGHNVGRWWNAMLRLEACTGYEIPRDIERAMLKHTWRLTDNPTGILLDNPQPDNVDTWYIHSYRETMLALGLLVACRGLDRAAEQGLRAIKQMRNASQDLALWDLSRCDNAPAGLEMSGVGSEPVYTHGRAIEGLICFYEATGASVALEEAERIAEFHFKHTLRADGDLAAGCGHHTHSYLNTLRGLLMLAKMKNHHGHLDSLRTTYSAAISRMITRSGFITHDIGDDSTRSGGDIASAGDIAHIALLLWDLHRDPALLDDAERIIRCRLIPAQVCRPMPITPRLDSADDPYVNLSQRFVGAIGGSVGHVREQSCVTDFTAAALHSLIELYQGAVDIDEQTIRINFHFDYEGPGWRVRCNRDVTDACVEVHNATGKDLFIRIPAWADRSSLLVSRDGARTKLIIREEYAVISRIHTSESVRLSYTLPVYTTVETWRDKFATRETVTFHWRGDEITSVDPIGPYLEPWPKVCSSFGD